MPLDLRLEFGILRWQLPSLRIKLIFLRKCSHHSFYISRQVVFPGNLINAVEEADFLVDFHPTEFFKCQWLINPHHIPIFIVSVRLYSPVINFASYLWYYLVLSMLYVKCDRPSYGLYIHLNLNG
jgi:hypothetical protein